MVSMLKLPEGGRFGRVGASADTVDSSSPGNLRGGGAGGCCEPEKGNLKGCSTVRGGGGGGTGALILGGLGSGLEIGGGGACFKSTVSCGWTVPGG